MNRWWCPHCGAELTAQLADSTSDAPTGFLCHTCGRLWEVIWVDGVAQLDCVACDDVQGEPSEEK